MFDTLQAAGADHGLVNAGYRAIESCRLEKGYRAWGSDIGPDHTPIEAGLGWAVKPDKGEFIGRAALVQALNDKSQPVRVGLVIDGKRRDTPERSEPTGYSIKPSGTEILSATERTTRSRSRW